MIRLARIVRTAGASSGSANLLSDFCKITQAESNASQMTRVCAESKVSFVRRGFKGMTRSLIQAGALSVSQPPAPGEVPLPMMAECTPDGTGCQSLSWQRRDVLAHVQPSKRAE